MLIHPWDGCFLLGNTVSLNGVIQGKYLYTVVVRGCNLFFVVVVLLLPLWPTSNCLVLLQRTAPSTSSAWSCRCRSPLWASSQSGQANTWLQQVSKVCVVCFGGCKCFRELLFIYLEWMNVILNYLSLCNVELAHMCMDFKKLRLQISRHCLGTFSVLDEDNIFIMCHFLFIMQHMMKLRKSLWCVEYYTKSCSGHISPFWYAETSSSSQFCWDVQFCSQFQSGP